MPNPTPESLICPHCQGSGKVGDATDHTIGGEMWTLRIDARVSRERLATAMDVSVSYVESLEVGLAGWNLGTIAAYRAALARAKEAARG